jgi:protein-L-isoaspartate(D-aspartate) O-methyltransferase
LARKPIIVPGGPRPQAPAARVLEPKWGQSVPTARKAQKPSSNAVVPTDPHLNPGLASDRYRDRMLERLRLAGIQSERVLKAMASVPRHRFVDPALASRAYEDTALPIGHAQTISQPYVVARSLSLALEAITHALPQPQTRPLRALEIGTGCGYQAAVMTHIFDEVVSLERIEPLHKAAVQRLAEMGYHATLKLADGQVSFDDALGFDVVVMAAGMAHPPPELLRQLRDGGVLVGPLGSPEQRLVVITQDRALGFKTSTHDVVQFVPIRSGIQR